MQSLCLKAFGWHVGRLYHIFLAEKGQVGLQSRIGVCMCPRKRKVSKFQVLRYRDRTSWRTTKVVPNVLLLCQNRRAPQPRMHDDGLVTQLSNNNTPEGKFHLEL
jgi:hypothetical protein